MRSIHGGQQTQREHTLEPVLVLLMQPLRVRTTLKAVVEEGRDLTRESWSSVSSDMKGAPECHETPPIFFFKKKKRTAQEIKEILEPHEKRTKTRR